MKKNKIPLITLKQNGYEEHLIVNNFKRNYCGKILIFPRGTSTSMHLHKIKHETFYVLEGEAIINLRDKEVILKPNEILEIKPNTLHKISNKQEAEISLKLLEVSTYDMYLDSYRKNKAIT